MGFYRACASVQGLRFRIRGLGFRGLVLRVWGSGFRVQGLGRMDLNTQGVEHRNTKKLRACPKPTRVSKV